MAPKGVFMDDQDSAEATSAIPSMECISGTAPRERLFVSTMCIRLPIHSVKTDHFRPRSI